MALALEIHRSAAGVLATVSDDRTNSTVGDGQVSALPATAELSGAERARHWIDDVVAATRLATDACSALGITGEDITSLRFGRRPGAPGLVLLADGGLVIDAVEDSDAPDEGGTPSAGDGSLVRGLTRFRQDSPERWAMITGVNLPLGWLLSELVGRPVLPTDVAACTGAIGNGDATRWATDALDAIDPRPWTVMLPELVPAGTTIGSPVPAMAERLGLALGVAVVA